MVWDCYGHMDLSICFFRSCCNRTVVGAASKQICSWRPVRITINFSCPFAQFETHSFYITYIYIYYLHHILHIYYLYHIYITSYITSYIHYSLPCVLFFWDGFRSECSEPYPWSHDTSPSCFDLPQHVPMHCPQKKQHLNFPARIFQ
jgi:hypothetical protein